jgi:hypothetical protein
MTKISGEVDAGQAGDAIGDALGSIPSKVRAAAKSAAQSMAKQIEEAGRADIESAGNFGSRWTQGFQATVSDAGDNITIEVTEAVPYWTVFEFGATISAKNASGMLWIPMGGAPKGVWPRDYPGRLFRVERRGGQKAPLLMDADTKTVVYHGHPSVTIPAKFHLRAIVQAEVDRLPLLFSVALKAQDDE